MDPTLKVMVVTKENAAAHAFAKHIESLQLPPSLEEKFGRLVGATELEKGPASQTKLDIVPGYRNTVLRTKQVIIGCGGGFHQECTQPYSPVARWMADVDVALNDEGQQYGNLDEASAIARIPRKGLVIWCGDHKQTPGGLRKSEEARVFRRKLMRRPIALRGDTTFLPPHMLGAIVHPYVKDVPGPQMAGVSQLLQESTKQPLGLSTGSVAVFQDLCKETIGGCWVAGITPCCCAAIAVLWMALAPERFPLQADTFSCAAGTAGKQTWSLILPSSARVSELTYVTIIGTRYPELDNVQNDIIQFGNYLQAEQCTRGGFIPIFWDAPYSYIQACTDIGEVVDWITDKFLVHNKGDLAVLHNRNKGQYLYQHGVGVRLRWCHHLAQRYVLCWYDGLSRITCSDQGGFPQWRAREKLPSAPSPRTSFPKRRGLCEGYSCSYPSATDLLHHGPIGHARTCWSCDDYRLLEIWCQFQWAG